MLAETVDETVVSQTNEEGTQMGDVGEAPASLAKSSKHVGPDRLDDVNGVEVGAQIGRKLAAHSHSQVRFVTLKYQAGRLVVPAAQFLEELLEGACAHAGSSAGLSQGRPASGA